MQPSVFAVALLLLTGCALPPGPTTWRPTVNLPGYDCFWVDGEGQTLPRYACGKLPRLKPSNASCFV